MLSEFTPSATVAVKNLKAVRSFYEGVLGFEPIGSTLRGAQVFKVRGATVVIYESPFAGTNKATAVTWTLGEHFDDVVNALDAKGVPFEHYEVPDIVLEGTCMWRGTVSPAVSPGLKTRMATCTI
ncbi:MAG TPA: VOC family protein [Steroidobacteraceae bacterium]